MDQAKMKTVVVIGAILLGFGFAGYFVWSEVVSAQLSYVKTYKDLISLEKKQDLITDLEKELASIQDDRAEVLSALLRQEDALSFIVQIENLARRVGLSYDVKILREATRESIDKERLAIARASRKQRNQAKQKTEEKLPGITFNIELEGPYAGTIRFLEGVASLPYYTHIESLSIASEGGPDNKPNVTTAVQLMVFTRE